MAIRYYPSSKIKTNQIALSGEFTLNGVVYIGDYYSTYDGRYFTGKDPILGTNQEIFPFPHFKDVHKFSPKNAPPSVLDKIDSLSNNRNRSLSQPMSYQPIATQPDYNRGYMIRYFLKRTNQNGYVMEISETTFNSIRNGTATYDVSFYQTIDILWKLTGPLRNKRVSQYNIKPGIIDTNQRVVEAADKKFIGIKEYIGEDYTRFAASTE